MRDLTTPCVDITLQTGVLPGGGSGESLVLVEDLPGTGREPVAEGSLLPIDGYDSFGFELLHMQRDCRGGKPEIICDIALGCAWRPEKVCKYRSRGLVPETGEGALLEGGIPLVSRKVPEMTPVVHGGHFSFPDEHIEVVAEPSS